MDIYRRANIITLMAGQVWLALMLLFPGDFAFLKIIFLSFFFVCSIIIIVYRSVHISTVFLYCLILWIFLALLSYLHGIYNGYIFSGNLFFYFILTPFICTILALSVDKNTIFVLHKVLVFSTFLIISINFYYMGFRLGLYNIPVSLLDFNFFGGTKITDTQLEIRTASQSSLIFLLPYVFVSLLYSEKKNIYATLSLMGFVVIFLSGRRSLQILYFFSFFTALMIYASSNKISIRKYINLFIYFIFGLIIVSLLISSVSEYLELNNPVKTFINTILLAFDSTEGGGVQRYMQSISLINFFSSSPLFGHGLNSHPLYIRNIDDPWSYEWVYLAFLAQNGIVFTTILFLFLLGIIFSNYKKAKFSDDIDLKIFYFGICNGGVSFMIAGGTNPMLYFSWFWFLAFISFRGIDKHDV